MEAIASVNNEQAERAKGSKEADPCEPGEDKRYSDLCAQWKAADAAKTAAWLSGASFAAVIVALWFAFRSNWIARDTAKRQLRAYIGVSDCEIGLYPVEGEIIIQLRLRNCGQTPAYSVSVMAESFAAPFPMEGDRPFHPVDDGWAMSVAPGMPITCVRRIKTNDVNAAIKEAQARRGAFYIQGVCEYRDAFKQPRKTWFRYAFAGTASDKGLVMQPAPDGNDST